ncbi:MAG: CotH kinase family protein [Flavobacteriales bacterium]|nr:CotH kinase family protein [Flavobacteriales bacterium]
MKRHICARAAMLPLCTLAQLQVPFGPVFPQDEVTEIRIVLDQDSLDQMLLEENWYSNHEYPATFIFSSSGLQDTIENVGFRLRGNTSREAFKKSFKVSFNTFDGGGDWMGLEKINLNGEHNDPSLLRSKLNWDMLREAGLPAARTSFTRLYVNDEYKGLYLNTEHIDETFVKRVFGENDSDGNLYKCLYPATLEYEGPDGDDYKTEFFGRRIYDLKTNRWADNYTDLAEFVDVLNNEPTSTLPCALKDVFHLNQYLRFAALEVLMGHWDGYIFNKNNYYLYHNQQSDQIEFIAYDLDNTLGIDWLGEDWAERDIYNYSPSGNERPLYERLMDNAETRMEFSAIMQSFIDDFFNTTAMTEKCEMWHALISEAVYEDTYRTMDYGFTNEDFDLAPWTAWGGHVDYGVVEYVEARVAEALDQLESGVLPEVVVHWVASDHPIIAPETLLVRAKISGPNASLCTMEFSNDLVSWIPSTAFSNGDSNWDDVTDDIYSWQLDVATPADKIWFRVVCEGVEATCGPSWVWTSGSTLPLVINETAAASDLFMDESGDHEDWIELFNTSATPMSLSGEFVTDDLGNPNKFPLPAVTLSSGAHRLIWCDDEPEEAPFHATFGLGNNDSMLYVLTRQEGKLRLIDSLSFTNLTGWSTEREPDGSDFIQLTDSPTPGSSNTGLITDHEVSEGFYCFPNPTTGILNFSHTVQRCQVFDCTGRKVIESKGMNKIDLSTLGSGIYVLVTDTWNGAVMVD